MARKKADTHAAKVERLPLVAVVQVFFSKQLKPGGKEWKAMSAADKAQYAAIAEKKEEYEKAIRGYNLGLSKGKAPSEEEGSNKSKSEVNDEDDDDDDEDDGGIRSLGFTAIE